MASKDCPFFVVADEVTREVSIWKRNVGSTTGTKKYSWEPTQERFEVVKQQAIELKNGLNQFENDLAEATASLEEKEDLLLVANRKLEKLHAVDGKAID